MADLIIETGKFDVNPIIGILEYYDSFEINVAGKSFHFSQDDQHKKLVEVFKEILKYFETGDKVEITYEEVF